MADASKLKNKRTSLGAPPPIEEARSDLAPQVQPIGNEGEKEKAPAPVRGSGKGLGNQESRQPELPAEKSERIDGRSLRRSGRTVQFATRVSPEFDERIRQIAKRKGLLLVEVLEQALDAYEARC